MGTRLNLLGPKPRRKSRGQLMHVCEVDGQYCGDEAGEVRVWMTCKKCGLSESHWLGVTAAKRGVPCPVCNKG